MKANKMQIILRFIGFTIKLSAMYLEVVSNWYHSIKTLLTLFLKFKTFLKRIQFRSSLHRTIKLSKLFKQLLMNYCNKLVMRGVARERRKRDLSSVACSPSDKWCWQGSLLYPIQWSRLSLCMFLYAYFTNLYHHPKIYSWYIFLVNTSKIFN